ncbi:MAG: NADAR family protein [Fermentimonas sp.]|nr:NADAR family protein [Dysgonamonadaceae bacterium]MDD4697753.1 NADAR family protein [Fermentimonas sp.]
MTIYIKNNWIRNSLNKLFELIMGREVCYPVIPHDNKILFYKRDRNEFGFLSNFYNSEFDLEGITWTSVEQYYQYQKSENKEYRRLILGAKNAATIKQLSDSRIGNKYQSDKSWFKQNPKDFRSNWKSVKYEIMKKAVEAKFQQNEKLKNRLIATQNSEIIEDSKWDFYWGTGHNNSGENNLGKILMQKREDSLNRKRQK